MVSVMQSVLRKISSYLFTILTIYGCYSPVAIYRHYSPIESDVAPYRTMFLGLLSIPYLILSIITDAGDWAFQ